MSWSYFGLPGAAGLSFSPQMTVLQQQEQFNLLSLIKYLPFLGKRRGYVGIKKTFFCLLCHFLHVWQNTLCWEAGGVGDMKIIIQLPAHGQQVCFQLLSAPCQTVAISTYGRWHFGLAA